MIKLSDKDEIPRGAGLHRSLIWWICWKNISMRKHLLSEWPLCRGTDWCTVPLWGLWITCAAHTPKPLNLASEELIWPRTHPSHAQFHSASHEAAVPPRRLLLTSRSDHSKVTARPHLSTRPRVYGITWELNLFQNHLIQWHTLMAVVIF